MGDWTNATLGDRYRIVRLLGVGALGSVYEATSAPFDRKCAIKVLHPHFANDDAVVQRFKREAKAAALLKHPHIIEVSDFSAEGDKPPFLVMELLTGQSLRALMKREGRLPADRAARIAVQVLSALEAAHDANIVHRDIKPENIFLTSTAATVDMVKVLDFGSAKLLGEAEGKPLTVTGVVIGTLSFMPPEQALGRRVDARADLYALAATIYAAVSGKKVLDAPTPADLLTAVEQRDPPKLATHGVNVDAAFEAILTKALRKNPAERFRTAREMALAFTKWLETAPLSWIGRQATLSTMTPGGVSIDADESYRRMRMPHSGSTLGRYQLGDLLGAGGLGEVFRAKDTALGRHVAVKVLRIARDADEVGLPVRAATRILVEARAAAKIRHPNAVEVFDVQYDVDGVAYLVMELVPGKTLRHFIGDPYVPIERKIGWLLDVACALAAAHAKGVVHQDIKPDNVMVRDDGVVKVLDFGIARRIFENDSSLPGTETMERIPGTPVYMAPEQMRGAKGTARTDQFTWAVFAYELLTGGIPWLQHGGVLHVVHEILTRTPEAPSHRRSEIPHEVDAVLLKALSKRPEDRYASMDDVIRALDAAWAEAASRPIDEIAVRRPPRRPFVTAAAAAMALLVGAIAPQKAPAPPDLATAPATTEFGSTLSSNPAAVAAYVAGADAIRNAARSVARKHFDDATRLDPSFAAAHLRRVLSAAEIGDGERENLRKATQLRDALGEHDRALLQAIGPWLAVPEDIPEVERRIAAISAAHPDADNLYQLCRFRMLAGNYAGAIESCRAAHDMDPAFAGAYSGEAQSRLFQNDVPGGTTALNACLRIAPTATSCISDAMQLHSNEGTCDEALGYAQKLVSIDPDNAVWLEPLGTLMFATGKPLADTRAVFERSWDASSTRSVAIRRTRARVYLAILTGDFEEARVHLEALERAVDATGDEVANVDAMRVRLRYLQEVGQESKGNDRARAFLAKHAAWSPSPVLLSGIEAWIALYRGGGTSRREMLTARAEWLTRNSVQSNVPGRFGNAAGRLWIWAYANAVVTADDARDALAALPRYLPLPPDRLRDSEDDEAIGRTYMMAGRTADALPYLRRASRSCKAALYPFEHTWANLELGQVLESTDVAGACAAYQVVLDRWATAATSRSAHTAYLRRQALGCH